MRVEFARYTLNKRGLEISPDMGLLRSVFSNHYVSLNKVINADHLSSICPFGIFAETWDCMVFSVFFWFLVSNL